MVGCGEVKDDLPPIESCTPNEFVRCNENVAQVCNAAGDGAVDTDCGAPGCNEGAARCNTCVPDAARCSPGGGDVERCDSDGMPAAPETCPLGCTEAPSPHCAYLQPTYAALADVCDEPAAMPALDVTTTQMLDTSSDLTCTGGVINQTGGPAICVLRFGTITVQAARTLKFIGTRAVALVADSAITVDGTIDASADGSTNGPGGGTATSGGGSSTAVGGGGAGFRTAGGAGGSDTANGGAATGGAASTNPAELVAFVGGPRPTIPITLGAAPGGGGAAVALIACRGTVTISATGVIDAGGGGGGGGRDLVAGPQISVTSAGGGGAGGNIVLQGLGVRVTGSLYANGGAGGGGTSSNDPLVGAAGQDGLRSTSPAQGGAPSGSGGAGGAGGVTGTMPRDGLMPPVTAGTPGGGGGSAGFIQTYTPAGAPPMLMPAAVSPPLGTNRTAQTR
ncbi:MAG TPA: hypothetical protein VK932_07010 [Kofleriaceae bacterium]|nr:hypothetical protein [Kofleriaceae bacterium]